MMFLAFLFVIGYVSQVMSAPAPIPSMSPAMHTVLMDMIQKLMNQPGPPMKMKPHLPPPPMKPPMPQYMPPARAPPPQPMPPPSGNNDVFMNIPSNGAGGMGGYGMSFGGTYCPPGPTSSDSCKDKKLIEALYFPDTTPRYNWVPPFPYDGSVPDSVKDTAQNILLMKVNSRPNRMIYPKEQELLSILGDIPGHHHHMGMG